MLLKIIFLFQLHAIESQYQQIISNMSSKILTTLIILVLIKIVNSNQFNPHFPKILWAYWHQGLETASTFTKLCLNNQRKYAERSGWQFRLLTSETLHKYVDAERIYAIWNLRGPYLIQSLSDIVRIFLLYEHGGMWMDANTFFIEDFRWLQSLKGHPYIYNQHGNYPHVMLGSFSDDPYIQYDTQPDNEVYPMPNIEDWFMIAKPKSQFFKDAIMTIEELGNKSLKQANQYYGKLGVNQRFNYTDYFMMSNYIFQIVVQLKEIQINKAKSPEEPKKYGVHHYKLWNMEAYKTGFTFFYIHQFKFNTYISSIFKYPLSTFRQSIRGPWHFIKQTSIIYNKANEVLDNYRQKYCLGQDISIRQGSLVDEYLIDVAQGIHSLSHIINQVKKSQSEEGRRQLCSNKTINDYHFGYFISYGLIACSFFALSYMVYQEKQTKRN